MTTKANNIIEVPDIKIPGIEAYKHEQDWDLILSEYFNNLYALKSRNIHSGPESGMDINNFFVLVKNAIISRENSEGVPSAHRLLFEEEEGPEEIDTEAITFELTRREPGDFSQGPIGQGNIKEVSPHYRGEIKDPGRPGERLVTMGKFYNNWITFYINAETNKQARKRLLWFEKVMEGFKWYFRLFGFNSVIYSNVGSRTSIKLGELKLTRYPVTYIIRTDDTFHVSRQELRHLAINASVAKQ